MADKKCRAQSFHVIKRYKSRRFICCNYYEMLFDTSDCEMDCEKCKVKESFKERKNDNEDQ